MSTPDRKTDEGARNGAPETAHAYKLNRAGLVPPKPAPAPLASAPVAAPGAGGIRSGAGTAAGGGGRRRVAGVVAACAAALVAAVLTFWHLSKGDGADERRERGGGLLAAAAAPAYRALVIGINQYRTSQDGWTSLQTARADAEEVARVLASDFGFGVTMLLDGEATRANILNALDGMATTGRDGADLIYFAGHGYFDEKLQEGYWIPADARKRVEGREAKEDWLWNSTITRLVGASSARHVLVMSDACYGGSLFRGDAPLQARGGSLWYERALAKPSRYLITSGGIEPVLDSGAGHSVFAQQVLNYLRHGDRPVFSANDLGAALRERVAELTGQMVQMGPLPVSGHAGGEFVFVRRGAGLAALPAAGRAGEEPGGGGTRGPQEEGPLAAQERAAAINDAVALARAGAAGAASNLVAAVLRRDAQDRLALAVAEYVGRAGRREVSDGLRQLIEQVEAKGRTAEAGGAAAGGAAPRPRVLACIGPVLAAGSDPASEGAALLYRIALRAELQARDGLTVIEREELEAVLGEMRLGVSDLADPRARLAIGKLLPASLLLLGDVIPSGNGERVFLRLVETETTRVLGSFSAERTQAELPERVCAELAGKIAARIAEVGP